MSYLSTWLYGGLPKQTNKQTNKLKPKNRAKSCISHRSPTRWDFCAMHEVTSSDTTPSPVGAARGSVFVAGNPLYTNEGRQCNAEPDFLSKRTTRWLTRWLMETQRKPGTTNLNSKYLSLPDLQALHRIYLNSRSSAYYYV